MKRTVIFACVCIGMQCWIHAQSDTKLWTRLAGSGSDDVGYSVAADGAGNVIIAGGTQGAVSGGNAGRYDMFVVKYNSAGNQVWARQRGTDEREFAFGVATDASGNIYTTGYSGYQLDGQPHAGAKGDFDVFVMKHDAAGNWQWTREFGFGPDDEGRGIATDNSGNVYVTGVIRGALDGLPRPGTADIFLRKYDSSGTKLWSALMGSSGVDEGMAVACDAEGNVFVTGWCSESVDGITPYQGNGDNVLAKYNSSGQQLWIRQWGTANKDTGYALATDAAGNVYVSGYTTGPLYGSPIGNRDYFVAKYDAAGNALWGRQMGTSGHDQGWGIGADAVGNVYVAGETGGSLGGINQGSLDVFLAKFNTSGTNLWTVQYGTSNDDLARGVAMGTNGVVFVGGWSNGNLDGNTSHGSFDGFVTKFSPATDVPPNAPNAVAATGVTSNAFTARWNAVSGATGYRIDVSTNATFATYLSGHENLNVNNVTNRTVTGLIPTTTYFYRVRAYNIHGTSPNSGTVAVTLASASPCAAIANSDFESGFTLAGGGYIANNWTEWEATPGVTVGFDETVLTHGGGHAQRIRVNTNASGGIFQRIPVAAGKAYTVGVWIFAADTLSACYLGVDPSGGTNANSGSVMWSSVTTNVSWVQKTWTGNATANLLTVFYKVASSDNNRRNGYFDDGTPGSGLSPLVFHRNGNTLVLKWPECPPARLEHIVNLTPPATWEPATNQIMVVAGEKQVSLSPGDGNDFFRLVPE